MTILSETFRAGDKGHLQAHTALNRYVISDGVQRITTPLVFPDNAHVVGAGIGRSIIDARGLDVAMYAPSKSSYVGGFTILGDGGIGIKADANHHPYNCNWGAICVRGFDIGIDFAVTGTPSYFNHFDVIRTQVCGIGINIDSLGDRFHFSASSFGTHFADNCGTALRINAEGRLSVGSVHYELCGTGVQALSGGPLTILGGGMEGGENKPCIYFDVSDVFTGLVYFGSIAITKGSININKSIDRASVLLPTTTTSQTFEMLGRWILPQATA